jgi:hypothetical protein
MKKIKLFAFFAMLPLAAVVLMSAEPWCPPGDFGMDLLFPNIDDCSTYYVCSHGEAVLHDCPEKLYFCDELKTCSWPTEELCSFNCTRNGGVIDPVVVTCGVFHGACYRWDPWWGGCSHTGSPSDHC